MRSRLQVIPVAQRSLWSDALEEIGVYDFYHLPGYQALAQERGEGNALLFVYREPGGVAAWPLLMRPIEGVTDKHRVPEGAMDLSSAYGYPGPLFSAHADGDAGFHLRFGRALLEHWRESGAVTAFSRIHPILNARPPHLGIGTMENSGWTIAIDLLPSEEEQWAGIRKSHRRDIERARDRGLVVWVDHEWRSIDDFVRLYRETMEHVGASAYYRFDREYLLQLRDALGGRAHLFVGSFGEEICTAGIFVLTGTILQYHLSCSNMACRRLSPGKALLDEARRWGKAHGAEHLHLGGGVGGQQDSLFHFKSGFSPDRRPFFVWKCVVDHKTYSGLKESVLTRHARRIEGIAAPSYFPEYRVLQARPFFTQK